MERQLQRLSWIQLKDLIPQKINTVILPVGTVEAHGSSCVGTDNFIPETISLGIAERINALVAPTVNYGITRSLYRYKGSTIRPDTFGAYIKDILVSFADNGFHNVIIMNGHGGNNSVLKSVALDTHQERTINIAVVHWWELCAKMTDEFFGHAGGHAGTDETAMVQAIDPTLTSKADYTKDVVYTFVPGADIYPVPGNVLLYKEGEGYPEFDIEKSKAYHAKVIVTVGDFVESVLGQWKKLGV